MRFAGDALAIPSHKQEEAQFIDWMRRRDAESPIQVSPGSMDPGQFMVPSPGVPEFDHPMMNPLKGPSYRDKWQFRRLMDEHSPFPLS